MKELTDKQIHDFLRELASVKQMSAFSRFSGIPLPTLQGLIRNVTNRESGYRQMTKYTRSNVSKAFRKWSAKHDICKTNYPGV